MKNTAGTHVYSLWGPAVCRQCFPNVAIHRRQARPFPRHRPEVLDRDYRWNSNNRPEQQHPKNNPKAVHRTGRPNPFSLLQRVSMGHCGSSGRNPVVCNCFARFCNHRRRFGRTGRRTCRGQSSA